MLWSLANGHFGVELVSMVSSLKGKKRWVYRDANMAIAAGMRSHASPFTKKRQNAVTPSAVPHFVLGIDGILFVDPFICAAFERACGIELRLCLNCKL